MGKLFKYEFKRTTPNFVLLFLTQVGAIILGFMALRNILPADFSGTIALSPDSPANTFLGILLSFCVLVFIVTAIIFFIMIAGLFRNDLYSDSGYLSLLLPLDASEMMGAKLLLSVLWGFLDVLIGSVTFIACAYLFFPSFMHEIVPQILQPFHNPVVSSIVTVIIYMISLFYSYTTLYFSVILNKVLFKQRFRALWFILWVLLIFALSILSDQIYRLVPYGYNFISNAIEKQNLMGPYLSPGSISFQDATAQVLMTPLSTSFLEVLYTIIFFNLGAYLLRKKLDF